MNTEITYAYKTDNGFEQYKTVLLEGELNIKDSDMIFFHGESFIPEQINLEPLQSKPWSNKLDHPFHTIIAIEKTSQPVNIDHMSVVDFHYIFTNTKWNESLSSAKNNLEIKMTC